MSVVILGAGIIGLSTACTLREHLDPRIDVTVIGEKFDSETTSYGAVGIFRIARSDENDIEQFKRWASVSVDYYYKLARSGDASKAGAIALPIWDLFNEERPIYRFYTGLTKDATEVSRPTLAKLGLPDDYQSANRLTTTVIESRYYLPFLREKFEAMGGQVERRKVKSLSELAGEYDIAVNCTGLGARELCNDSKMIPVRGQIVRVRAPWVKMGLNHDRTTTSVFPLRDHVALGTVYQVGIEDCSISETDTSDIMERTRGLEPSLAGAVIEDVWAGIRPVRKKIRLEIDPTSFDLPVVHNYGHGSRGVALAYGCAIEAAEKTEQLFKRLKS